MNFKVCITCSEKKDAADFYARHGECKVCGSARSRAWYHANKDRARETNKRYCRTNPAARALHGQRYRARHKSKVTARSNRYSKQRKQRDIGYRLLLNLRARFNMAIRSNAKSGSAVRDLGCSIANLKLYLESKFTEGMSWDNYGRSGWHIDHIVPLSHYDLTDREQLLKACHFTNLQPLWAKDNYRKGARVEKAGGGSFKLASLTLEVGVKNGVTRQRGEKSIGSN